MYVCMYVRTYVRTYICIMYAGRLELLADSLFLAFPGWALFPSVAFQKFTFWISFQTLKL